MKKLLFSLSLILALGTQAAWSQSASVEKLFKDLEKDHTFGGVLRYSDSKNEPNTVVMDGNRAISYHLIQETTNTKKKKEIQKRIAELQSSPVYTLLWEANEYGDVVKYFVRKEGDKVTETVMVQSITEPYGDESEDDIFISRFFGNYNNQTIQQRVEAIQATWAPQPKVQRAWNKNTTIEDLFNALDKDDTYNGLLKSTVQEQTPQSLRAGATKIKQYVYNSECEDYNAKLAFGKFLFNAKPSGTFVPMMEVKRDYLVKLYLKKEDDGIKELALIAAGGDDEVTIVRFWGDFDEETLRKSFEEEGGLDLTGVL